MAAFIWFITYERHTRAGWSTTMVEPPAPPQNMALSFGDIGIRSLGKA